ncbi:MAG: PP2C family protein-serine/threonine phosphatase, partial [Spirochaetota bacterium]
KSAITSLEDKNLSPSESLAEINRYLIHSQKMMSYTYATVCFCFFNIESGTVVFSNAGIPGPLVLKESGGMETLDANGPYVGIFENAEYAEETVSISPGDRILFFSDGVFESGEKEDATFGYRNLINFITELKSRGVDDLVDSVFARGIDTRDHRTIWDDVTVLGIKFNQRT